MTPADWAIGLGVIAAIISITIPVAWWLARPRHRTVLVTPGENLYALARRHQLSYVRLCQLNRKRLWMVQWRPSDRDSIAPRCYLRSRWRVK